MSDAAQEIQQELDIEQPDIQEVETPEYSEAEARAREHGWKPFEEYVENGGNPEMWRGAGAFNQYHDVQKKSDMEIKSLRSDIQKMSDGFAKLSEQQQRKYKAELEAERAKARADLDVDKVEELTSQISSLENKPEEKRQPQPEAEVFTQFRQANPELDPTSSQYDADLNLIVENKVNNRLIAMMNQGAQVTDDVVQRVMKEEFGQVKTKFSPTQKRNPPNVNTPKGKVIKKSAYEQLAPEAKEMYDILKRSQSEEAAELFAKSQLEA